MALVMKTNSTVCKAVCNNKRKTGIFTTPVIYIRVNFECLNKTGWYNIIILK
jgi:hypothetical protein